MQSNEKICVEYDGNCQHTEGNDDRVGMMMTITANIYCAFKCQISRNSLDVYYVT